MSKAPRPPKRPAAQAKPAQPLRDPAAKRPNLLHPRNRHQGHYDFPALIEGCPELGRFVITNPYGKPSIDFANPEAVRLFNRALLKAQYGIGQWDIPAGFLCPPIPGRADYVHYLADLLAEDNGGSVPRGPDVRVLDIGVGANCIYPLIGHRDYGWRFLGSDIEPAALASAHAIVNGNPGLAEAIELRQQHEPTHIFRGLLSADERFDATLCNPPFHSSPEEASSGSRRKWKNLGKLDPSRQLPKLNFGGQSNELWCDGGEIAFLRKLAVESAEVGRQVRWFSSLVSKAGNLDDLRRALKKAGAISIRTVDMAQGQKQSRFVAWTFLEPEHRRARP
ncbi:23S rRNA (adenine(1618)-N(6))-methyltransferase RlmF [Pseudomonas nitroreducens]|uniref:Ribosomal RNA large subunit methyltransferase F n=1 Tax=Pseudomonas nitroreducens TaxID=46680 RepID=A0A2D0AD19_PSENT|nr:23S rRNA (adenine(1618)-N(6))-methyltransferase RlmF [Pseudomonas nitroreducens]OWP49559.1 23S rRNA (adenine(1618)-N(6))-methyltransferase [Pseudomonas nitroreducens]